MSIILGVRFLFGRYHATAWDRNVNEGIPDWPPSPWRICRALVATWHERCDDLPREQVSTIVAAMSAPPRYLLPASSPGHTRHYFPAHDHREGVKTSTDKILDAFISVASDDELLVGWDAELGAQDRAALGRLADNVGYLGRAESACDVRLLPEGERLPSEVEGLLTPVAAGDATEHRLLGMAAGIALADLEVTPTDVRRRKLLSPPKSQWVDYTSVSPQLPSPDDSPPHRRRATVRPDAVRWQMVAPDVKPGRGGAGLPTVHAGLVMTVALRQAAQSKFGNLAEGRASETLSGKSGQGEPMSGHVHAHYLTLDLDADHHLDTFVCWAPAGFGEDEVRALTAIRKLTPRDYYSDFRPVLLGLEAVGSIETVAPGFLTSPTRDASPAAPTWRSVTPFVPPRHPKKRRTHLEDAEVQVREELKRRGLPNPVRVTPIDGRWLDFRRHRPPRQRLGSARRGFGFEIEFGEPVGGPICLGMHSHYGLGLFSPV